MKRIILITLLAVLAIPLTISSSYAFTSFLNTVNATCGTSYDCGICHIDPGGGGPLTATGLAFVSSGNNPCAICPDAPACAPPPVCTDADSDGYFAEPDCGTAVDCNDNDAAINPGATEVCNDSIDNDCDGLIDCADPDCTTAPNCAPPPVCTDADSDSYFAEPDCGTAVDCNDSNAAINPGALEVCNDNIDNDCDGLADCADPDCTASPNCAPPPVCTDADSDGYFAEPGCGTSVDCNDNDAAVNPGAVEVCDDGGDNDCDGTIDCADTECSTTPACVQEPSPEVCNDFIDNDGDRKVDCADSDCYRDPDCAGTKGKPVEGLRKTCSDGIDNDGDGLVDCDDPDCVRNKSCKGLFMLKNENYKNGHDR